MYLHITLVTRLSPAASREVLSLTETLQKPDVTCSWSVTRFLSYLLPYMLIFRSALSCFEVDLSQYISLYRAAVTLLPVLSELHSYEQTVQQVRRILELFEFHIFSCGNPVYKVNCSVSNRKINTPLFN